MTAAPARIGTPTTNGYLVRCAACTWEREYRSRAAARAGLAGHANRCAGAHARRDRDDQAVTS